MSNQTNNGEHNDFTVLPPQDENPKVENIKRLEDGPNPCILYSIIQLGKHYSEYKGVKSDYASPMVLLTFEFPLLKQKFRVNDTELRPTVLSLEEKQILVEKSNLTKIARGMLGREISAQEFRTGINLTQFIGKTFIVDVETGTSKAGKTYQNIVKTSFKVATERNKSVYGFDWDKVVLNNDIVKFGIGNPAKSLTSRTFAELPNWIREKIKSSEEAIAFIEGGGVFSERKDFKDDEAPEKQQKPAPQTSGDTEFPDLDDIDGNDTFI